MSCQGGEYIKADPRCIVSRGVGLALRPPATVDNKGSGVLDGLKRRIRNEAEKPVRGNPLHLQRLSNTMASNVTDCLLAPPFPGTVSLVSISSSRGASGGGSQSMSSSRREKPRKLVVLSQAIVATGPEVTVQAFPSEDRGRRRGRGGDLAAMGALSVCEGKGQLALSGYGKILKVRLKPGQKRVVGSSHAVGWTSGAMCLAGAGERASRASGSGSDTNIGAGSPSAVSTFVGPGTVYVQTHSLSGLRRLLLPKSGAGSSLHSGRGRGRGRGGAAAAPAPRRGGAVVVGLSLKRGLAKRAKAVAKRVLFASAFFALYLVVYSVATALLLEGRDGLVNAPRHALQVVRSLIKVARRVVTVLIRVVREELWRKGEVGGAVDASVPQGSSIR